MVKGPSGILCPRPCALNVLHATLAGLNLTFNATKIQSIPLVETEIVIYFALLSLKNFLLTLVHDEAHYSGP